MLSLSLIVRKRARWLGIVGRPLIWLAAAVVVAIPFASPGSPVSLIPVALEQSIPLTITGSITGLAPGVPTLLQLTLHNGSDVAVPVRTLTVTVTGGSAGCPPQSLSIGNWTGLTTVPAHSHTVAALPLRLRKSADGCAGATWQLAYAAT